MNMPRQFCILLWCGLLMAGCTREPGSTQLTKGALRVDCDEAIAPVVRLLVEEFQRQYPDAKVTVNPVEAREATANFVNDSVRVIVVARPLNAEERSVLTTTKTWFEEYHVAQGAVAVIANTTNPVKALRLGQADSIFAGLVTVWPGWRAGGTIDVVVGGINSSTNEVFREAILGSRKYALSATPFTSSSELLDHVRQTRNAIGLLSVSWLKGVEHDVSVLGLSRPGVSPDSTQSPGRPYTPIQGFVFKGYYPVSTPVYIYTRSVDRDVALGFISFASSGQGQKVFLNNGLVPVKSPVRLIQLTSEQVK
jgi:phosphate transport system substrate-binding protein